jgi:aryl-alcohol dehydrogenase-like predicted oxidoreductase
MLARGVERSLLPTARRYGMGVLTWSPLAWGFLSGKYRKNRPVDLTTGRAALAPDRFDPESPANAAKYDAVEQLAGLADDLGRSLPELAVAFVISHPAVTSVITGPRTMEQLDATLAGTDLVLDDATLDRIDAIVAPGTDLYPADSAWRPRSLTAAAERRLPLADRGA